MTLFDDPGGGARRRLRMMLAYDGTGFHGFAAQSEVRTVEGVLARAFEKVLHHPPVDFACAGRTDAGVHAWGQVVSMECDPGLDPWRLQSALNGLLAPEIVVRACDIVAPDFHARHSARWRQYRYTIVNRPAPDPFLSRYAWWVPEALDRHALLTAADPFIGEHDFTSFCRKGPDGSTATRRVLDSRWCDGGDGVLRYEIRANAFCWQMVRAIVGTLVDVGRGRRTPGDILAIMRARDRARAGNLAPAHGLCLWEVGYADDAS